MNPEIKTKWVEALRSGKYKQGKKSLRSREGDKYCCLGVLCDLYAANKWRIREPLNEFDTRFAYIYMRGRNHTSRKMWSNGVV